MVEGMFVVGVKPKSLGEGVIPVVYTADYARAWQYWDNHPGHNYMIYRWSRGALKCVGRRMRHKNGSIVWIPVPPAHIEISA